MSVKIIYYCCSVSYPETINIKLFKLLFADNLIIFQKSFGFKQCGGEWMAALEKTNKIECIKWKRFST